MQESPEREARNLVDAGAQFSTRRFQTRLISHAQRMLQNSKSAYYALVKDVVTYADHDNITTFGVNLGYNSCTKRPAHPGDRAGKGLQHPLGAALEGQPGKACPATPACTPPSCGRAPLWAFTPICSLCRGMPGGAAPGDGVPGLRLSPVFGGGAITPAFLEELAPLKNVMVSGPPGGGHGAGLPGLAGGGQAVRCPRQLQRGGGRLCAQRQVAGERPAARPVFAFLRADLSCTDRTQAEVYQYVTAVRDGQHYPLILMDVARDSLLIDQVISEGECLVGFDQDGSLRTHQGFRREEQGNIFHHPLEEILRLYTPKPAAKKEAVTQSVTAL